MRQEDQIVEIEGADDEDRRQVAEAHGERRYRDAGLSLRQRGCGGVMEEIVEVEGGRVRPNRTPHPCSKSTVQTLLGKYYF